MPPKATGHELIDAFSRGEASAVRLALAPDAVFHSPVADYRGHDQIAPVLEALLRVLRVTANVAVHGDDTETVCFFRADVGGQQADGVLRVVAVPGGRVGDVTLMIRPLDALLEGLKGMERALRPNARPTRRFPLSVDGESASRLLRPRASPCRGRLSLHACSGIRGASRARFWPLRCWRRVGS
jgi:SnoaL-like domain